MLGVGAGGADVVVAYYGRIVASEVPIARQSFA